MGHEIIIILILAANQSVDRASECSAPYFVLKLNDTNEMKLM